MPLQHQGGVFKRQAAGLHGQGRGGHQQIHHAIAQGRGHGRDHKHRLAHDLAQGAARPGLLVFRGQGRKLNLRDHGHRQQGDACQRQVGPGKGHRRYVLGEHGQVGANHRADQATSHHPGHSLFAKTGLAQFSGRKAVQLCIGTVIAGHHRGADQPPKLMVADGPSTQAGRKERHQQAQLKGNFAAKAMLGARHQAGAERAAHHVAHDRQGRHPTQGREAEPDQPVDGDEGHVVREKQTLGQGQQQQVSVHVCFYR